MDVTILYQKNRSFFNNFNFNNIIERYRERMKSIIFTEKQINTCIDFANSINTSYYASRSQINDDKRKNDQLIGKLGEIATYEILKYKLPNLTYPDFKIYEAKGKSWAFDLMTTDVNLHVKSQSAESGKRYGISWIFQSTDKEIFGRVTPNQYISFVTINLQIKQAIIRAIVKLDFLHDNNLFDYPKLDYLKTNNKRAVYLDSLQKFTNEEIWYLI